MTEFTEKAVFLEDFSRVQSVISLLDHLYDRDAWTGGILFVASGGGFLLVVNFDQEHYRQRRIPFEALFPERDLRVVTLAEACAERRRYQPWLSGDIPTALRGLRLLPEPVVRYIDPAELAGSGHPGSGAR